MREMVLSVKDSSGPTTLRVPMLSSPGQVLMVSQAPVSDSKSSAAKVRTGNLSQGGKVSRL